jgi:hypothetical protein
VKSNGHAQRDGSFLQVLLVLLLLLLLPGVRKGVFPEYRFVGELKSLLPGL